MWSEKRPWFVTSVIKLKIFPTLKKGQDSLSQEMRYRISNIRKNIAIWYLWKWGENLLKSEKMSWFVTSVIGGRIKFPTLENGTSTLERFGTSKNEVNNFWHQGKDHDFSPREMRYRISDTRKKITLCYLWKWGENWWHQRKGHHSLPLVIKSKNIPELIKKGQYSSFEQHDLGIQRIHLPKKDYLCHTADGKII